MDTMGWDGRLRKSTTMKCEAKADSALSPQLCTAIYSARTMGRRREFAPLKVARKAETGHFSPTWH